MKRKFLIISWLGFLTGICLSFFSCTKDLKDDIRDLQKPVLAGIVMLDTDTMEILKGEEFKIRFRVNPSGFQVSKENFALDVLKSDVYIPQKEDEGKAETRASYINPLYYECLSVEPDKNESDEILDGQWVACMKAVTDVNLMSFDHVVPVISYRDVNGQLQLITATSGCVLNVLPTAEESLHIYCPKAQTLDLVGVNAEPSTLPYIILIDHYYYENKAGKKWSYDYNQFVDAKVAFGNGEESLFTLDKSKLKRGGVFLEPDISENEWIVFKESNEKYIDFNFTLQLFGKNEELIIEKPLSMRYYRRSEYEAEPMEISVEAINKDGEVEIPFKKYFEILEIDESKVGTLSRIRRGGNQKQVKEKEGRWVLPKYLAGEPGNEKDSFVSQYICTMLLGDLDAHELKDYYVMSTKVSVPLLFTE